MQKQVIDWEQIEAEELERMAQLEQKSALKRWAKYPRPNPLTFAYGYGSTLYKLQGDMNNYELTPITRAKAAENIEKIKRNLQDKKLMDMRACLLRAAEAGDQEAIKHYTGKMRLYLGEDPETGYY